MNFLQHLSDRQIVGICIGLMFVFVFPLYFLFRRLVRSKSTGAGVPYYPSPVNRGRCYGWSGRHNFKVIYDVMPVNPVSLVNLDWIPDSDDLDRLSTKIMVGLMCPRCGRFERFRTEVDLSRERSEIIQRDIEKLETQHE